MRDKDREAMMAETLKVAGAMLLSLVLISQEMSLPAGQAREEPSLNTPGATTKRDLEGNLLVLSVD